MKIKTVFIFIAFFMCIVIYCSFAVQKKRGPEFAISIDLVKPSAIESPCEISIVGNNGEKGLRIAPKAGRGWKEEAGGKASYKFFVPQTGKYRIWAYCLWFDVCANAIFAKIDNWDKAIVGNDPIYKKWHWVRGFDVNLKEGSHSLELSNHSDHISIQKIILANSASVEPQLIGQVFSDIFYDDFDGCDQGNFSSWKQISGIWQVMNPECQNNPKVNNSNYLIGQSQDLAFITYKNIDWQNYNLNVLIKTLPVNIQDGTVGICFGLTDPNTFTQLRIKPHANSKQASVAVIDKNSELLFEGELDFVVDTWQQIQIALKNGYVEIKIADNNPIKVETNHKIAGGIGFLLEGGITAYFDNIHVSEITEIKQQHI